MSATLGDGYRWARITPDDRSGILYIVTFLAFTYTSLTFLTRLFIRWRMLGLDDAAMLIAQVASVVQFSLLLASLSTGLGRSSASLTKDQYSWMASTYSRGQVFIYISLGFSKTALILLVRRLFMRDMKHAWAVCNVATAVIITWTLASAVLVSAGCASESLLSRESAEMCHGLEIRYMVVVISDGITDFLLAFIPTYLCRRLQMNIVFKLQILGVFALRLPLIVLAGLFYKTWSSSFHGENPGVDRTTALIYQQSQLCFSLIAATIPCLKSFIQSFDTGSGQKAGVGYSTQSSGYGHVSSVHHSTVHFDHDESIQLSRFDRGEGRPSRLRGGVNEGAVRVNRKPYVVESSLDADDSIGELDRRSTQESDRKSQHSTQELFIRKDVQFEVKHEPVKKGLDTHRPGLLRLLK